MTSFKANIKHEFNISEGHFMNMIKVDTECKKFFKHPQRFADFINGAFLDGKQVIKENQICPWDAEETFVLEERNKDKRSIDRYRDIVMKVTIENQHLLIALENQNENDFSMVLRTYEYDSMNYVKQWNTHPNTPKNRFILPVVTFVTHWGQPSFTAKKELKDITTGIPKPFQDIFNHYHMNFKDVKDMDIHLFKNDDVKNAIDLIQRIYKTNKKNYMETLNKVYVNKEILEFVAVITNIEALYEKALQLKESEMLDMCEAFRNFLDESRAEGQSEGIVQGRAEGENTAIVKCVKTLMNKLQINATQSMDMLDVPQHQRQAIQNLI